jgi:hypothetical protein
MFLSKIEQKTKKSLTHEELHKSLHRQWEERLADTCTSERYLQARQRIAATYGHLLTKSYRLILLRLMEAADFLWRRLEKCQDQFGRDQQ